MKKKNPNKPHRPRSPLGIHVARRNATSAPFKHRLEPKQGAKNDQPELLEELCTCNTDPDVPLDINCPIHSTEEHEFDL